MNLQPETIDYSNYQKNAPGLIQQMQDRRGSSKLGAVGNQIIKETHAAGHIR
jgi:hypothetical protein